MNEISSSFSLVQPFYIDNHELDKLSQQEIFVLGYEFGHISDLLDQRKPFEVQFHSDNDDRVRKMLKDKKVKQYNIYPHDDWPVLEVIEI